MKESPHLERSDLLSILLTDELFCNDEVMIIDECMTFFFAGFQTTSVASQNLIMHVMKQPKY